ncbi:MAG: glycosyltransferase [Clostridiales bacterium]|nr:glycosyltransferase [Clostridiales bacterium]
MTLTVICDVLGKENNGTSIAAMNLIRSMRAKGHTVRVVCPDEFRRGEKDYFVVPTLNLGPLNGYLAKNGVLLARRDKAVLKEALDGADAAHIITPFLLCSQAAKLAHEMGIPLTAGFHCQAENFTNHLFLMNAKGVNKLVYKVFDRFVYRYVDCIHYPTEFICRTFESEIKHKTPHRVISNGVNRRFKPMPCEKPEEFRDKFVILFTGRYSKEKSHGLLIDAAALSKHSDDIQLIFAGCGPQEEKLKKRSRKLKNPPVFRFFSREDMVKVLNFSDLYVHPAEIELEAIACLEAISCGLVPVINDSPRSATRYFAQSDMNLFKFNDPADLAKKIDWWIEHPAEKESCSRSYTGYSARFDFDHCMDEMERMILENAEAYREAR